MTRRKSTGMTRMDAIATPSFSPGRKDDAGKVRWDLMPFDALGQIARVMTHGAAKYEDRNWERGMLWSRPYAALMRHMSAWWHAHLDENDGTDPEWGISHLAHAGCCLLFLLAYEVRRMTKFDDRPKRQQARSEA